MDRLKTILRIGGIVMALIGILCFPVGLGVSPKRDLSFFSTLADLGVFLRMGIALIAVGLVALGSRIRHVLTAFMVLQTVAACNGPTKPTPTLASLVVSCDASRLTELGQQAHCTAGAMLSNGQAEDRTAAAQWSSSDPSKVTVNSGVATAVAPGSADVSAKVDVMSAKQTMTVDVGCAFTLSPASVVLAAEGGTQVVNVSAAPAGCAPSTWTAASNDAGLTVSPSQGSGSAAFTVTVAANGTKSQVRTATIAGQTLTANVALAATRSVEPPA